MHITNYRDGGTLSIRGSFPVNGQYLELEVCVDYRIGSKTKGTWFIGYPKDGMKCTEEFKAIVKKKVTEHQKFTNHLCDEILKKDKKC